MERCRMPDARCQMPDAGYRIICFFLIILSGTPSFPQPGQEIVKRVDSLNALAAYYAPLNFDSSIIFATKAERIAVQTGYHRAHGVARFNRGNAYYYKLDFRNALVSYLSAQPILEKGPYENELGELFLMLGHINFFIARDDKATRYYRKALEYFYRTGNEPLVSETYYAMALTTGRNGNIDTAISYGNMLADYAKSKHDRYGEANAVGLTGMTFPDKRAVEYAQKAIKIAFELKDNTLLSILYNNLASYYDRSTPDFEVKGDLKRSRAYYDTAYDFALKAKYFTILSMITGSLASIDIEEGKLAQAGRNLDECEHWLKVHDESPYVKLKFVPSSGFYKVFDSYLILQARKDLYQRRYDLARALEDYPRAMEYLNLYYMARDSMNAASQGRQLELMITEDEAVKQSQKMNTLSQQNELNQLRLSRSRLIFLGSGAGILIVSMSLLLFFQRRNLQAERKSVQMEQRLLRAQMNPHFIFNSLASIQNFVINENSDQASIYLSRFSQLVRNILDNSLEEYVSLEREISTIENYLELQMVRYAGKFDYTITVDERIDPDTLQIPPMLAQPFIENAIEHGISHKESKGHIDIRFLLDDGLIRFAVEDNGVGREKAREIESKKRPGHRSMATSITRDRLNALNKKLRKKIRMEITDLRDEKGHGCGTRVEFGIPGTGG